MVSNPLGFLFSPRGQWQKVASLSASQYGSTWLYPLILSALPCIAWYYGITVVGWTVGDNQDTTRFTPESATKMISAFYVAMVLTLAAIGYAIHWMADTYGSESSLSKGIAIAGFAATPLFIAGACGFYPLLWLDLTLGIISVGWAVYLLYLGIPIVMDIPEERGFLFASAILAVCMVLLMVLMGASVILWDMGFMPVFTD